MHIKRSAIFAVPTIALTMLATAALAQPADGQGPGGRHGQRDPAAAFAAMDANHDGFVSRDEWIAAGRRPQMFDRIDAKKAGKITLDDMKAFRANVARRGGGRFRGGAGGPAGQDAPTTQQ